MLFFFFSFLQTSRFTAVVFASFPFRGGNVGARCNSSVGSTMFTVQGPGYTASGVPRVWTRESRVPWPLLGGTGPSVGGVSLLLSCHPAGSGR